MEVADEIVVMNLPVEQVGTPAVMAATAFVIVWSSERVAQQLRIFQGNGFDSTHPEIFLRPQDVVVERANGTTVPARVSRLIHLVGKFRRN